MMTPERIARLREGWGKAHGPVSDMILECLSEIERLQTIKPAPTMAQVVDAMRTKNIQPTADAQNAMRQSGLFADDPRAPGWYWVKVEENEVYRPMAWTGRAWDTIRWRRRRRPITPAVIGPRIEYPQAAP